MNSNKSVPRHVLVYRLSALGDVAMTIPAIYSCARRWKDTTFHVVTTAFCAQMFVNAPANVVLHPLEMPVTTWRVLKALHKMKIDAVADLHNVLRSWIVDSMFWLRGKRVQVLPKRRQERYEILHEKMRSQPFVMRYFEVFKHLGLPCEPAFTTLFNEQPPLPVEMKKDGEQWIGIAPYARYENKTYPLEKMQEVVKCLAEKPNVRIFLFGARGEQADGLKQWEQLSPRVHSMAGRFTLNEEMALMAHLDVMVSMDSANMHMASLVGTRVVSVWGSTTPACGFLGWGQHIQNAVCANIDCQPCSIGGSNQCKQGNIACMAAIKPDAIVQTVCSLIK